MVYEVSNQVFQVQQHGAPFDQRDIIHAEAGLQVGELIQLVQHHLGIGVTLYLDDDADVARTQVAYFGDTFYLLFADQLAYFLHQVGFHHAEGQLGDDNLLTAVVFGLNVGIRADDDTSPTRLKSVADALIAVYGTAGREIGSLDVLHQVLHGDIFRFGVLDAGLAVVDKCHTAVNNFAQVVRSHIRGHTYGNTRSAVYQQVREAAGQDGRFTQRVIEVQLHIHGIFVDIAQHLFGQF